MIGELVPVHEAARRAGVSQATIRRRVAAGEITLYGSPLNRRERLVRLEDLAKYAEARPIVRPSLSDNGGPERVA